MLIKQFFLFLITLFHTTSFNMYVPRKKTFQQNTFTIIASKSRYIQNLQEINPELTIDNLLESLSRFKPLSHLKRSSLLQLLNELAEIHKNKPSNAEQATSLLKKIKQIPIEDLIILMNLEEILLIPYSHELQASFLDRIKTENLMTLESLLVDLNRDRAANMISAFVQKEKIDSKLLNLYSKWLFNHPLILPNNKKESFSAYEDLLFYNDEIKIYGVIYSIMNEPNSYDRFVIKQTNHPTKIMDFNGEFIENPDVAVNNNSTYCIVKERQYNNLWNLKTIQKYKFINEQEHELKNETAYCFANDDKLCVADRKGNIKLLSLNQTDQEIFITNINLKENEIISQLEYRITSNNTQLIIALTSTDTLVIIENKQIVHTLPSSNWLGESKTVKDINLNNSGTKLSITAHKVPANPFGEKEEIYLLDISSLEKDPIEVNYTDDQSYRLRLHWTKDDNLFIVQYYYRIPNSIKFKSKAIIPSTLNYFDLDIAYSPISQDGNTCIITEEGIFSTTTKQVILCNNIISDTLNCFNKTKESTADDTLTITGVVMLYQLLQKQQPVILNEAACGIYSNNLPTSIKTILEKANVVQSAEESLQQSQQQSILASLRNPLSSLYNSLSTQISEHRYKLLGGLSALSIAALYQYFKNK